ncbi:MAG: hypothetical protein ACR2JX_06205 [Mycobacteriales bacterium]
MVYKDSAGERPFLAQRRTWMAALVLLAVIGCLMWVILGSGGRDDAKPRPASKTAPPVNTRTSTARPPSDSTYDSACGLSGGTTTVPKIDSDVPNIEWPNVKNGWYLPLSDQYGPGKHAGSGAWSCYSRTPMGAVLAGYTISMQVEGLADDFTDAVKTGTMPGIGQNVLLAKGKQKISDSPVIPKGFVIDRYSNDEATVTFYLHTTQSAFTCSIEVAWDGGATGDWKLRLAANGQTPQGCITGPPSRYLPWGP